MGTTQAHDLPSTLLAEALAGRQNADGGWSAADGGVSNAECTALACLALAGADRRVLDVLDAGQHWLLRQQHAGGAWSYSAETPLAPWPTPIVLLSLAGRPDAARARERGFAWLLESRGANFGWVARIRELLSGERLVELDDRLAGWPWAPETFSWVEPTSWALVALKAEWPGRQPRAVRSRVREGEDMLLDRACVGGGWNYGNSRVLGEDLPAYPDTTALALMGLRGRTVPAVDDAFSALDALLDVHASVLSLSLAILARRAWDRAAGNLPARLAERLHESSASLDTRSLALAAIASARTTEWLQEAAVA